MYSLLKRKSKPPKPGWDGRRLCNVVERGRLSELTQQKKKKKNTGSSSSSPPAVVRCLDRPFEDPEILWSDKDICYKWGWWQFGFFGTLCHSWLKCERKLNNSIWQFLGKRKKNKTARAMLWYGTVEKTQLVYSHLLIIQDLFTVI